MVGYLLLTRRGAKALVCGVGQLALELVLCGAQTEAGGVWVWLAPLLRAADLLLLVLACLYLLTLTGKQPRALPAALAAAWLVYAAASFFPQAAAVSAPAFLVFSVLLLWFTVLMLRAYNETRVREPRRR